MPECRGAPVSAEDRRRLVWRIAAEAADDPTAVMTATTPKSAVQLLRWVDGVRDFRARHLLKDVSAAAGLLELVVVVDGGAAAFFDDSTYGAEAGRLVANIVGRGQVGVGCFVAFDGDQGRLPAALRDALPLAGLSLAASEVPS
jgi:hypothetical protein